MKQEANHRKNWGNAEICHIGSQYCGDMGHEDREKSTQATSLRKGLREEVAPKGRQKRASIQRMKEKLKEDAALRLCMRKSFVEHGNECEQEGRQDQPHWDRSCHGTHGGLTEVELHR